MPKLKPPASGVTIRMYRQGHGDCFLLAMQTTKGKPLYMLIDCGLWTGSEIKADETIDKIIADIAEATGNRLDVVLVTHEHMDHVNGFAKRDDSGTLCFDPIKIGALWLSWTEDGSDAFAQKLRERFNDTLLALAGADEKLADAGLPIDSSKRDMLRSLLSFETGEQAGEGLRQSLRAIKAKKPNLSAREQGELAIAGITNKKAIKYLRDRVGGDPLFLQAEHAPYELNGPGGIRVYVLGPPRDQKLLLSLDPVGSEGFNRIAAVTSARGLLAATASGDPLQTEGRCFDPRFGMLRKDVEGEHAALLEPLIKSAYELERSGGSPAKEVETIWTFFADHYGTRNVADAEMGWRQIDTDWLASAETLALRLNDEVNNTSLVIAIELRKTGKVLLFPGDAQRGNWISWSNLKWNVDGKTVTARDLLGRTVFYKVGHHGSHNATLSGEVASDYANLSWLGRGKFKDDFVAVIPANAKWAKSKKKWTHPLPSIETALKAKAFGRVFRNDTDKVPKPDDVTKADWAKFKRRETGLFFEYTVLDES
jgi:beta-lactamase superfamily II metal-dependent hydrolase